MFKGCLMTTAQPKENCNFEEKFEPNCVVKLCVFVITTATTTKAATTTAAKTKASTKLQF